jgi:hypothetical protein
VFSGATLVPGNSGKVTVLYFRGDGVRFDGFNPLQRRLNLREQAAERKTGV